MTLFINLLELVDQQINQMAEKIIYLKVLNIDEDKDNNGKTVEDTIDENE